MGNKKEREISVIKHRSGAKVPLMFDPNSDSLEFSARIGEHVIKGTDSAKVIRDTHAYLDSTLSLKWVPVIEISTDKASYHQNYSTENSLRHSFPFAAARMYLAQKADKSVIKLDFDTFTDCADDAERLTSSTSYRRDFDLSALPHVGKQHQSASVVLPYNDETWAGLNALYDGFTRLEQSVTELFHTTDGHSKIAAIGTGLLRLLPPTTGIDESSDAVTGAGDK